MEESSCELRVLHSWGVAFWTTNGLAQNTVRFIPIVQEMSSRLPILLIDLDMHTADWF